MHSPFTFVLGVVALEVLLGKDIVFEVDERARRKVDIELRRRVSDFCCSVFYRFLF